jgi:catechol 2,3-dioxygenase-like lactoylglutathione lyase family enzyme
MLADKNAVATLGVKDLARARAFYENTLGLPVSGGMEMGVVLFRTGSTNLLVYESSFAGTNQATAVTWTLGGEVDATVEALRQKGVTFEHYDMPDIKREGDVHIGGGMRMAWFKDPDGNIICLVSE